MARIILLNKPFHVMCQFTDKENRKTLADYIHKKGFYAAGRLDYDSEGLLLLTDDGKLQHQISHPLHKLKKTYLVQVEGIPLPDHIQQLTNGVNLKDGITLPASVELVSEPHWLWPRTPPIRERANKPTSWLSITLTEGKNRQVRRMTAAVGFPTLRLIRWAIGDWQLDALAPGSYREEQTHLPAAPRSRSRTRHKPHNKTKK